MLGVSPTPTFVALRFFIAGIDGGGAGDHSCGDVEAMECHLTLLVALQFSLFLNNSEIV